MPAQMPCTLHLGKTREAAERELGHSMSLLTVRDKNNQSAYHEQDKLEQPAGMLTLRCRPRTGAKVASWCFGKLHSATSSSSSVAQVGSPRARDAAPANSF